MIEQWVPVAGHPNYSVSDQGRVWSEPRKATRGGIKQQCLAPKGYLTVSLTSGLRTRAYEVHRLLLASFVGPRPEGMVARHLNGIQTDNRLENLCWGTYSENLRDSVAHGTHPGASKTTCAQGHLFSHTSGGQRRCRTCIRASQQRYLAKRRDD